jgi:hypothetical protein
MSTLCIVPCGKRKIWIEKPLAGPTTAKDVYIGPFAKTCIRYAQTFYPHSFCILSAKHGFLRPDELIPEDYNVSFKLLKTNPISVEKLIESADSKGLFDYQQIIAIVGLEYLARIRAVFPDKSISTPLARCRNMGEMISALMQAIYSGNSL